MKFKPKKFHTSPLYLSSNILKLPAKIFTISILWLVHIYILNTLLWDIFNQNIKKTNSTKIFYYYATHKQLSNWNYILFLNYKAKQKSSLVSRNQSGENFHHAPTHVVECVLVYIFLIEKKARKQKNEKETKEEKRISMENPTS